MAVDYPLKQVLEVKQKRVEEAEKVVKQKQNALDKENEKLKKCEEERDKMKNHYQDKLVQLRVLLDSELTTDKVISQKNYLKIAQEKVKVEEKKVLDQQKQVELATKNLKAAEEELRAKRQEVDKLEIHRKDWTKEMRKEEEKSEAREQDEVGTMTYMSNQRRRES